MKNYRISILGGGNIGTSLAKGLLASGEISPDELLLTEKREQRISTLRKLGFEVTSNNAEAVSSSAMIVLSVKPQQFTSLAAEIKKSVRPGLIIISTVTGVTLNEIESVLGVNPIVRIMPNIALEICESMTCMTFRNTSPDQEDMITGLFEKMGRTQVIPEDLMGAATVAGACGIAFVLRFMRAMTQGGIEIGFDSEMSLNIAAQTIKGAAGLIIETSNHPETEIDKVTTPQGVTISGLNEMEHQGLSSAVIRGLLTSFKKLENLK